MVENARPQSLLPDLSGDRQRIFTQADLLEGVHMVKSVHWAQISGFL